MAETRREKDDFTNASTGLLKDNTAGDISAQDVRDVVESLAPAFGGYWFSTSAATTPAGAGTPLKALGTTTQTGVYQFTHASGNRLTYDAGQPDIGAFVTATLAVAGGGSIAGAIGIALNGSLIAASDVTVALTTSPQAVPVSVYTALSASDYLEVFVTNDDDTTTITVTEGHVFVQGLFK